MTRTVPSSNPMSEEATRLAWRAHQHAQEELLDATRGMPLVPVPSAEWQLALSVYQVRLTKVDEARRALNVLLYGGGVRQIERRKFSRGLARTGAA